MANDFLQGLQVGAGIGSNILQNNARLQQLKSERAQQMAQERASAQIMAMKMAENDRLIQYRADMAKGMSAFQMATSPVVPVMGPGGPIGEVPNPKPLTQTQAALQFILPVIGKFDPEKVPAAMQDIAMTEYRQRAANQVGQPRALTLEEATLLDERSQTEQARQEKLMAETNKVRGIGAPSQQQLEAQAKQMGMVPSRMTATGEVSYGRPQTGTIMRMRPDGTTEIIQGATAGDITNADRSDLKQRTIRLEDTARRIQPVIDHADAIFGPLAAGKTLVIDRTLSNIFPGLAEGTRIQGRQGSKLIAEAVIRSMTEGQGQLSNKDVERITVAFPELNNLEEVFESPARAKLLFKGLQKHLSRDAAVDARVLGEKPSMDVLRHADPAFVREEFQAGRITEKEYREAINNSVHKAEIENSLKAR